MAAAREIRAGRAFVELYLKDKIGTGLLRASKRIRAFAQSMTMLGVRMAAIGTAITAPLAIASRIFATMGDELSKASQRTGIAVSALSELQYAAKQSGASAEGLEASLRAMSRVITDAAQGGKEARESLALLGLTIEEIKDLPPDAQFKLLADSLSKIKDPTLRAALAMKVFGKSGTQLIPMLEQGAAGIDLLQKRARGLGIVMSGEDAAAAVRFGDAIADLTAQFKALVFNVGAAVAKFLQPFADKATKTMATIIAWVKANRGLVLSLAALGAGITGVGAFFMVFGTALGGVAASMSIVATVAKSLPAVFALLISPLGLVTAGLAVGAVAFFKYSDAGRMALSDLLATAKTTMSALADALAAGDIALAGEILWTGLKLAWLQGTQAIRTTWIKFTTGIFKAAALAFYGVQQIWANVTASIQTAIVKVTSAFMTKWVSAIGFVAGVLRSAGFTSIDPGAAMKAAGGLPKQENVDAEIAAIEAERLATLEKIARLEAGLTAEANAQQDAEIAALEAQKLSLAAKLAELRAQAGAPGSPQSKAAAAAAEGTDVVSQQLSSRVGFNPRALLSFQGGSEMARTAKATEQTARNTARIANAGGGIFV